MDIVVNARHTKVADRFRDSANDKLQKITQVAPEAQRVEVQVSREANPRLASEAERVEVTVFGLGAVVRAEASADDRYAALDLAQTKVLERLRRLRGRRKRLLVRNAASIRTGGVPTLDETEGSAAAVATLTAPERVEHDHVDEQAAAESQEDYSPVVVREKQLEPAKMDVQEAIDRLELVGHDFFMFEDAETGVPSVVYRRRGWNYGVIRMGSVPGE